MNPAQPGPTRVVTSRPSRESLAVALPRGLRGIHIQNATEPIRFPSVGGAFPDDFLLAPPPIVPDANRLRDDVLYACGHNQRTVLITAANAGLFRLFCGEHVMREVVEHSEEWTEQAGVSQREFLARWLLEYLPVIRVIPDAVDLGSLLNLVERGRIQQLVRADPDDVPSASLAIVLGALYLSNDGPALLAVYADALNHLDHSR
jgi:predicted nucleic acid-binding protein